MQKRIRPGLFRKGPLRAFFTTRHLGAKREMLARETGMSEESVYLPIQKHTNCAFLLRTDMRPRIADAVITRRKNVLLGVRVSDCVPILIYDRRTMACGAVHAGWRGTAGGILMNTIRKMEEEFSSDPSDLLIAVGPAVRQCCYEVGREVLESVSARTGSGNYHDETEGRIHVDLPSANRIQAISAGVPEAGIWLSSECTCCNPHRFYSYRYSGRVAGSQGGFIGITG